MAHCIRVYDKNGKRMPAVSVNTNSKLCTVVIRDSQGIESHVESEYDRLAIYPLAPIWALKRAKTLGIPLDRLPDEDGIGLASSVSEGIDEDPQIENI